MRPDEILRRLRKSKKIGKHLKVVKHRGKGSHRMVYYKGKRSTLKKGGDVGPGTYKAFLKQLGIKPEDL